MAPEDIWVGDGGEAGAGEALRYGRLTSQPGPARAVGLPYPESGSRLVLVGFLQEGPRPVRVPAALWPCRLGVRDGNLPEPLASPVISWFLEAAWVSEGWLCCPPACTAFPAWAVAASGELQFGQSQFCLTDTPLWFALCRVAPQEGREPHPLHHGSHCQVRGPAPAA